MLIPQELQLSPFFQYYKQFTEKNSTTGNILSYIQPFDPINY